MEREAGLDVDTDTTYCRFTVRRIKMSGKHSSGQGNPKEHINIGFTLSERPLKTHPEITSLRKRCLPDVGLPSTSGKQAASKIAWQAMRKRYVPSETEQLIYTFTLLAGKINGLPKKKT
jgi:hypothetical protein